jgi:homoserine kinase type II
MLAKWSVAPDRFSRLDTLAGLTAWIDDRGLPVSAPVAALDGRIQVEASGASMCLQKQIHGELLDVSGLDRVRYAGAVLARLHAELSKYPHTDELPGLRAPTHSLSAQIAGWLAGAPEHVPPGALRALRLMLANAPSDALPTQQRGSNEADGQPCNRRGPITFAGMRQLTVFRTAPIAAVDHSKPDRRGATLLRLRPVHQSPK